MQINHLTSTEQIVDLIPPYQGRVWTGRASDGSTVYALIARIAVPKGSGAERLADQELQETPPTPGLAPAVEAISTRMIL